MAYTLSPTVVYKHAEAYGDNTEVITRKEWWETGTGLQFVPLLHTQKFVPNYKCGPGNNVLKN
jgi:hypothetical protein